MDRNDFIDSAITCGFTEDMAEFMWKYLAKFPHTHDIDDVVGLEEALEDIEDAEEEEEEEEE